MGQPSCRKILRMDFPQFGSVTLNCSFPFEENDYGASPIYIFNSSDRNTMSQVFPPLLVDRGVFNIISINIFEVSPAKNCSWACYLTMKRQHTIEIREIGSLGFFCGQIFVTLAQKNYHAS